MSIQLKDTIVAPATAPGQAAIAIVRMSGDDAIAIADRVFHGKDLTSVESHTLHFGTIRDGDEVIDEVLVSVFLNPHSYTTENLIEISTHGSPYIVDRILKLLLSHGARMADHGEFTMRAFLNGKLDLSQAEAVADLISSESEAAHNLAITQMRGGFSAEIQKLRERLIHFASMIELELDFGEEDVEFANRDELLSLVNKVIKLIHSLTESYQYGNVLKNGVSTVIAGRPNAGKSTLLNAILNEERALVSDIAGTTRDTIEESIQIKGVQFRMIDTAGIREAVDTIEAMGVERTMDKIRTSTLVLYVFDVTSSSPEKLVEEVQNDVDKLEIPKNRLLVIANKMDRNPYLDVTDFHNDIITSDNLITASAINKMNVPYITEKLYDLALEQGLNSDSTVVTNARHYQALIEASHSLERVTESLRSDISSDFVAMDIRQALHHLGVITGEVTTDDLLEKIFRDFCIGK